MSTVTNTRSEFWTEHFAKLAKTESARNEQLDFSNHALVVQNYAYMLEACGALAGKRVLDAGFGTGDLARSFDMLGGTVSAIDVVKNRIPHLRELAPSIAWWQGDLSEWTLPANSEQFDIVSACESLQYVEFDDAVNRLLAAVSDGGRLVILIPNSDCPIVQRVSARFAHQYVGVSMKSLGERLRPLATEHYISYRGIYFQEDQTLAPYRSGPWLRIGAAQSEVSTKIPDGQPSSKPIALHQAESVPAPHTPKTNTSNTPQTHLADSFKGQPANRLQIVISRTDK